MNDNNKLQILMETFELIKTDLEDDHDSIARVLKQIQAINPQKAIELWHDLVKTNESYFCSDFSEYGPTHFMTCWMYTELAESDDFIASEKYFLEDTWLLDAVFSACPYFYCSIMKTIDSLLKQGRFSEADEIFELILLNDIALERTELYELLNYEFNNKLTYHKTYYDRVDHHEKRKFPEEAIEMFKRWIDNVDDKKKKMKLLSGILEFMED